VPLRIERLKKVFLVMGVAVAVGMPPVSGDGEYFYSGGQKWYLESAGDSIAVRTLLPMTVQEAEAAMGTEGGQLEWKTARSFVDQRALLIPVRDPSPAKVAQLAGRLRRHPAVESLLLSHSFGGSAVVLTSDIVAQFGGAPSSADRDRIARKYGVKFVRPLGRYAPNGYLLRIVDFTGKSPLRVASSIYEKEGVLFCHPDFIWPKAKRSFTPDDPLYVNQWHLNNTGQAGTAGSDVNAPEAWDISMGAGVIIAVVDDGVDLDHEDFQATGKLLPGFDFDQNDNDPRPGSGDHHGTSVAGVATAVGNNGIGVSGVSPESRLLPVRLGSSTTSEAQCIEFAATNGADVINNSWGPIDGLGINVPLPDVVRTAIDYAADRGRGGKGCVIFWAAGNGNESVELDGYASYEKVIAVGATNDQDIRSYYSDFGPSLDICAPSNDSGHTGITTTDRMGSAGYSFTNYTSTFGGTSSASPLACGIGALILSVNPALTRQEVQAILQNTADKIDPENAAYDSNGHSRKYGYGRVNAYAALVAAQQGVEGAPRVTSIAPNSGDNTGNLSITNLAGTDFQSGATVKLMRTGQSDIVATNVVVVNSGKITCSLDLSGKTTGTWSVVVTNPDNKSGILPGGFTIADAATHDVALTAYSASPTTVSRGRTVTFNCTVKNNGNVTETNLTFRLTYNGQPLGQPKTIASLGAGQQTSGSIKFRVPRRQKTGDYLITGTLSTVPGETNTANNSQTVKVTVK